MAKQSFETRIKTLFRSFTTHNRTAHDLAIEAIVHFGQHGDVSMLEKFTAAAFGCQAHFRYQAFKQWLTDHIPVKVIEPTEKAPALSIQVDRNKPKFDAAMLAKCKATPFFEYIPADKPLTAPKIPENLAVTLARGLATGELTEKDISAFAKTLLADAKTKVSDPKVQEWANKYKAQHLDDPAQVQAALLLARGKPVRKQRQDKVLSPAEQNERGRAAA